MNGKRVILGGLDKNVHVSRAYIHSFFNSSVFHHGISLAVLHNSSALSCSVLFTFVQHNHILALYSPASPSL